MFRHHEEGTTEHARRGDSSMKKKKTQRSPRKPRARRHARSKNGQATGGRKRQQKAHRSGTPSAKLGEEEGHEGQDKVTGKNE